MEFGRCVHALIFVMLVGLAPADHPDQFWHELAVDELAMGDATPQIAVDWTQVTAVSKTSTTLQVRRIEQKSSGNHWPVLSGLQPA